MQNDSKVKLAIIGLVSVAAFVYAAYWYKSLQPVPALTDQIKADSANKKLALLNATDDTAADATGDLQVRQVQVPSITVDEYTTPHFVRSSPPHGDVVRLDGLTSVRLEFSKPLTKQSTLDVLIGNRIVGSGGTLSNGNMSLSIALNAGTFAERVFPTGSYEVYYQACFEGDTCYKGQYAFAGIQP